MVIGMLLGRLEEDGSAVFIYVCCSGGDKEEAGRCGVTTARGGQLTWTFFQTLLRVRPKPAAKLHYMKVVDAYE